MGKEPPFFSAAAHWTFELGKKGWPHSIRSGTKADLRAKDQSPTHNKEYMRVWLEGALNAPEMDHHMFLLQRGGGGGGGEQKIMY